MSSEKAVERRKAILRAKGVPEKFVDAIATRRDNRWADAGLVILGFILICAGSVATTTASTMLRPQIVRIMFPEVRSAFLFSTGEFSLWFDMVTMLGAMMLFLFVSFYLLSNLFDQPARPYPAYSSWASSLRTLSRQTLKSVQSNKKYQALAYLPDDTAFLEALRGESPRALAGVVRLLLLVFVPAAIILGVLSSQDYWVIKADTFAVHEPGQAAATYRLQDALRGTASCTSGRHGGFEYWLVFRDRKLNLWQFEQVDQDIRGSELTRRIGQIDQRLRDAHIPVLRMGSRRGETAAQFRDCLTRSYAFKPGGNSNFLNRLSYH